MVIYKSKKNNKTKISKINGGKPHEHDNPLIILYYILKKKGC